MSVRFELHGVEWVVKNNRFGERVVVKAGQRSRGTLVEAVVDDSGFDRDWRHEVWAADQELTARICGCAQN